MTKTKMITFIFSILLISTIFTTFPYQAVKPNTNMEYPSLFNEINNGLNEDNGVISSWFPHIIRWREVSINKKILNSSIIGKNSTIILNLFNDSIFESTVDYISINILNTKIIYGRIYGNFHGTFSFTKTGKNCYIMIELPSMNKLFITQYYSANNIHYLIELNRSDIKELPDENALFPPIPNDYPINNSTSNSNEFFNTNIDFMIVYTPAAKTWANDNGGGIENVISQVVAKNQMTLDNSDTFTNMNLVQSKEINYIESGSVSTDLNRLTNTNDGYMDEVHTWRDQYGADLVQLFEVLNGTGGIAWLLNNPSGTPTHGFSIVRIQQASTGYTPIHEIGHNMGCGHHKNQNYQPGPGLFGYSAGWRWVGLDNYCTVMTYESGQYFADGIDHFRIPHFSNPSIYYEGYSTGHAADGDNARTIRDVKTVVSSYRPSNIRIDILQDVFDRGFPIRHAADGDWAGAQNFIPTVSLMTNGSIYLRKFGNPEFDLVVELRENGIHGTLHDTLIFTPSEIPTSWTWLDLNFTDISINPGNQYFIVCPPAPSGVTTSFGYEWGYAFGNQYDDGSFWFTRDGGNLWRDLPTMYEFVFRTYGYS